jgi:hypothetical protein
MLAFTIISMYDVKTLKNMALSCETLIDAVQNEPAIWNTQLNSNEEEKELAWKRISAVVKKRKHM